MATVYDIDMAQSKAEAGILDWRPRQTGTERVEVEKVFRPAASNVISFQKARRRRRGTTRFMVEVGVVCCVAILINALIALIYSGAL